MHARSLFCLGLILLAATVARPAEALVGVPAPGAVSATTLKVPDGPGSIQGLNDKATVDVFSAQVSRWSKAYEPHQPPSSPLGEAIRYLLNHHEALGRFLDDGASPLDNDIVERLHVHARR